MKQTCPICHKTINPSVTKQPKNACFLPFCSERCKLIDLGVWLDAGYKVVSDLQSSEPDMLPEKSTSQTDSR